LHANARGANHKGLFALAFLGVVGFVLAGKPKQTGLLSRFFGFAKLVGAYFVLSFGLVGWFLVWFPTN
jgi:hypothetical protein